MKVLLSFVFVSFSFLGFSQEREQLETPAQLDYRNVQLWSFQQPDIIDVEKEIKESQMPRFSGFFIGGCLDQPIYYSFTVRYELPKQEKEIEIISNGLPTQHGGGFVSLAKNPESGWY